MAVFVEKDIGRVKIPEVGARDDRKWAWWIHEIRMSLVCGGKIGSRHCW